MPVSRDPFNAENRLSCRRIQRPQIDVQPVCRLGSGRQTRSANPPDPLLPLARQVIQTLSVPIALTDHTAQNFRKREETLRPHQPELPKADHHHNKTEKDQDFFNALKSTMTPTRNGCNLPLDGSRTSMLVSRD